MTEGRGSGRQGGQETDHVSPSARSSSQQPRDSRRRRCTSLVFQVSTRARAHWHARPCCAQEGLEAGARQAMGAAGARTSASTSPAMAR